MTAPFSPANRTQAILFYVRDHPRASIREIGTAVGIGSTSIVDYHLRVLEREGLIKRRPMQSRSIVVDGRECVCNELCPCHD